MIFLLYGHTAQRSGTDTPASAKAISRLIHTQRFPDVDQYAKELCSAIDDAIQEQARVSKHRRDDGTFRLHMSAAMRELSMAGNFTTNAGVVDHPFIADASPQWASRVLLDGIRRWRGGVGMSVHAAIREHVNEIFHGVTGVVDAVLKKIKSLATSASQDFPLLVLYKGLIFGDTPEACVSILRHVYEQISKAEWMLNSSDASKLCAAAVYPRDLFPRDLQEWFHRRLASRPRNPALLTQTVAHIINEGRDPRQMRLLAHLKTQCNLDEFGVVDLIPCLLKHASGTVVPGISTHNISRVLSSTRSAVHQRVTLRCVGVVG